MSASSSVESTTPVAASGRSRGPERPRREWIGVDLSAFATGQPSRALLPLLVLALVTALGVASLRIDLIRTRYALAAAMDEEKRLIEEQHALIVQKLQGRDPVDLAILAKQRGFRPTAPSLSLADPLPSPSSRSRFDLETISPPAVAAAPPHFGRDLEAVAR